MAIKQYSLAKDGAKQLAPGFRVREFRCRDGTDTIMIDEALVVLLQCIREHFGKAVTITSGYDTAVDKSLLLGCYQEPDGTKGRFFDGTLYQCLVYDKALTDEQVKTWITTE